MGYGEGGGLSLALPWELGNTSYPQSGLLLTSFSTPHLPTHSPILCFPLAFLPHFSSLHQFLFLTFQGSAAFCRLLVTFSPTISQRPYSFSLLFPPLFISSLLLILPLPSSSLPFFPILTPPPSFPCSCSPYFLLWAQGIPHLFKQKKKEPLH